MQKPYQPAGSPAKDDETSGVSRIAESAREVAEDAAGFAKKKIEQVREIADEKAEELVTWIKDRPITSVLIGAALGYLLGRLTRR